MDNSSKVQKRYIVVFSRYIFADNDDDAVKIANEIKDNDNKTNDCSCEIDMLYEQPFGTLFHGDNILNRNEEGAYEGDGNFADNH